MQAGPVLGPTVLWTTISHEVLGISKSGRDGCHDLMETPSVGVVALCSLASLCNVGWSRWSDRRVEPATRSKGP